MMLALLLANLLTLSATTHTLELTTSSSSAVACTASWTDQTTTAFTPGSTATAISSATTTTLVAAPAASTQRAITALTCTVTGASANTLTLKLDVSATEYVIGPAVAMGAGQTLTIDNAGGFTRRLKNGAVVSGAMSSGALPTRVHGQAGAVTPEAGGVRVILKAAASAATVSPAWVPGTPGLNGDALDCSTAADATIAGSPLLPAAPTFNYLNIGTWVGSGLGHVEFYDIVWYNTGLVVTTTTEQAITQPALPARDASGTNNGEGWIAVLFNSSASDMTNGAITNTTLNYTDSDGNAGNTATMTSWPASMKSSGGVPFQLAGGDRGIRSIQGITLGTTYVDQSLSLALLRPLVNIPVTTSGANARSQLPAAEWSLGVRLWAGTCVWPVLIGSSVIAIAGMLGSHTVTVR